MKGRFATTLCGQPALEAFASQEQGKPEKTKQQSESKKQAKKQAKEETKKERKAEGGELARYAVAPSENIPSLDLLNGEGVAKDAPDPQAGSRKWLRSGS